MVNIIKVYPDGSTAVSQTLPTLAEAREYLAKYALTFGENVIAQDQNGFTVTTSRGDTAYEVRA